VISNITLFFLLKIIFFENSLFSQEKFEGMIVSIDKEIITTYDLSQRIKLALKSLNLEDSISNRDSVRERMLELLILEKVKTIEAKKNDISHTEEELINFTSNIYNFSKDDFDGFKSFLEEEGFDVDILLDQMSSELLWKKFLQKTIASKIIISEQEIQDSFDEHTKNKGKYEFDYNEVLFLNDLPGNWKKSKKKMEEFLKLLDKGITFENLSKKFNEVYTMESQSSRWVLEDNIENTTKESLQKMKPGEILSFQDTDGYKVVKLNKKRFYGSSNFRYSFLKLSAFDEETLKKIQKDDINCGMVSETLKNNVELTKFEKILLDEMSKIFRINLEILDEGEMTSILKNKAEFMRLKLCKKEVDKKSAISKIDIEKKIYTQKFNQMANTLISNLRKNTNVKFFNK
jgi:peptidyl-prolyl cis-trans isomerase SurA